MNLNLIAYSIYLLITLIIIIKVGSICHRNGNIFISNLIPDDIEYGIRINNLLLTGYYLLNIGYAVVTLSNWSTILNLPQMLEIISYHTAIIICALASLHYFNLFWITKFIKTSKKL
ncbi:MULTISPECIES: hypothetical protein [Aquimarina]|uniref:Uncharacterized protein n=1 Tax=Aquimarina algiphila TaxID=2047982 RepID=A0A554VR09_9FLAO|nr:MULTISPECIES: hypothetical protein [Aquimarina]TSE11058.1 hypothetical protein FOF46_02195 [Aquimarina algiphila]